MATNQQLLTVQDVAKTLKCSLQTVRNYIKEGKLTAYKIEGMYRIPNNKLQEFIEDRRVV